MQTPSRADDRAADLLVPEALPVAALGEVAAVRDEDVAVLRPHGVHELPEDHPVVPLVVVVAHLLRTRGAARSWSAFVYSSTISAWCRSRSW